MQSLAHTMRSVYSANPTKSPEQTESFYNARRVDDTKDVMFFAGRGLVDAVFLLGGTKRKNESRCPLAYIKGRLRSTQQGFRLTPMSLGVMVERTNQWHKCQIRRFED